MSLFKKVGSTVSAAGKDSLSKARDLKDTARISMDIRDLECDIRNMFLEIGEGYYQAHKGDESPEYEQIESITASYEQIERLKSERDEIKGIRRCASCGSELDPGASFCSHCGAKWESEAEEVECEVADDEAGKASEGTE